MSKKLKLLRNTALVQGRDAAVTALQNKLKTAEDGELIVIRYEEGEEGAKTIDTIMGVAYKAEGATEATYTIFDSKAIPEDVADAFNQFNVVKVETGLAVNVKEAYKIIGPDGSQLGVQIPIYKDSSLHAVKLGMMGDTVDTATGDITDYAGNEPDKKADALVFVYHKEDGSYELVAISVADFLRESEFKNGLKVENGQVSVKLDETADSDSVKFLEFVGTEDGKKAIGLKGITAAIEAAAGEVQYELNTVKASIGLEENGSLAAFNGTILTAAEDTIVSALNKFESTILDNEEVTAQAFAAFKNVVGIDGDPIVYEKYNDSVIKNATSLMDADKKLADEIAALQEAAGETLETVEGSNAIDVTARAEQKQTISLKVREDGGLSIDTNGVGIKFKNDNAINDFFVLDANGLSLSDNAVFDCGTY